MESNLTNRCFFTGRIWKDPIFRGQDENVVTFIVSVSPYSTSDRVTYTTVKCLGYSDIANALRTYYPDYSVVRVECYLRTMKYTKSDGYETKVTEFVVRNIEFYDKSQMAWFGVKSNE